VEKGILREAAWATPKTLGKTVGKWEVKNVWTKKKKKNPGGSGTPARRRLSQWTKKKIQRAAEPGLDGEQNN